MIIYYINLIYVKAKPLIILKTSLSVSYTLKCFHIINEIHWRTLKLIMNEKRRYLMINNDWAGKKFRQEPVAETEAEDISDHWPHKNQLAIFFFAQWSMVFHRRICGLQCCTILWTIAWRFRAACSYPRDLISYESVLDLCFLCNDHKLIINIM